MSKAVVPVWSGETSGKYNRHIAVVERAIGMSLPKGAQVHHVNGDKGDNRHSNLVVCQDAAYHMLLHVRARVVRLGGNPNTDRICVTCTQPCAMTLMRGSDRRGRSCLPCLRAHKRESARRAYWRDPLKFNQRASNYRTTHGDHVRALERARYHARKVASCG